MNPNKVYSCDVPTLIAIYNQLKEFEREAQADARWVSAKTDTPSKSHQLVVVDIESKELGVAFAYELVYYKKPMGGLHLYRVNISAVKYGEEAEFESYVTKFP